MSPFTIVVRYEMRPAMADEPYTYTFSASLPELGVRATGGSSRDAVNNLFNIITDRGIDAMRSLGGSKP